MATVILYASKHGCTQTCAQKIAEQATGDVDVLPIKGVKGSLLEKYDTVVLGGSIHAGRIMGAVKRFTKKNSPVLLSKKLGLFICCMEEGEKAGEQLRNAFPPELLQHAAISDFLGGAFHFERMDPITRKIIKKMSGVEENVDKIDEQKIAAFARLIS